MGVADAPGLPTGDTKEPGGGKGIGMGSAACGSVRPRAWRYWSKVIARLLGPKALAGVFMQALGPQ